MLTLTCFYYLHLVLLFSTFKACLPSLFFFYLFFNLLPILFYFFLCLIYPYDLYRHFSVNLFSEWGGFYRVCWVWGLWFSWFYFHYLSLLHYSVAAHFTILQVLCSNVLEDFFQKRKILLSNYILRYMFHFTIVNYKVIITSYLWICTVLEILIPTIEKCDKNYIV